MTVGGKHYRSIRSLKANFHKVFCMGFLFGSFAESETVTTPSPKHEP